MNTYRFGTAGHVLSIQSKSSTTLFFEHRILSVTICAFVPDRTRKATSGSDDERRYMFALKNLTNVSMASEARVACSGTVQSPLRGMNAETVEDRVLVERSKQRRIATKTLLRILYANGLGTHLSNKGLTDYRVTRY